jgi:hypothetical protein
MRTRSFRIPQRAEAKADQALALCGDDRLRTLPTIPLGLRLGLRSNLPAASEEPDNRHEPAMSWQTWKGTD